LIVICSPTAARSRWVDQEVETFKKLGRSDAIYCLIVGGDPGTAGSEQDCFPPTLRILYDGNGQKLESPAEPIAADVRGDGRRVAGLKIIAGLLGVGLDDLRQREAHRRMQRLALITVASVLISVVTVVLAIRATLASREAAQRAQQAEELLGFMVGDLRSSLQPIGRLDLLESIGAQAQQYFATVDVGTLTEAELLRQAEVLTQLGQIHLERLRYGQALVAFGDAHARSATLVDQDPNDGERLFNRGQAEFWIGYVHWRSGSLIDAEAWLANYRDTSLALRDIDPANIAWLREVGYAYHNLAVLAEDQGRLEEAERGYEFLLEILLSLESTENDSQLQRDIADAISWQGNLLLARSDLGGAREQYARSAERLRRAEAIEPGNAITLDELAFALQRLAQLSAITGGKAEALTLCEESRALFDGLAESDPTNLDVLRRSMMPRLLMAQILAARRDFASASRLSREVRSTLEVLVAQGGTEHQLFSELANLHLLLSSLEARQGQREVALEHAVLAVQHLAEIQEAGRLSDEHVFALARALIHQGRLLSATGSQEGARMAWSEAETLLESRLSDQATHLILDPWARLLSATGRAAEAARVQGRLDSSGYVPLEPWLEG
jgi:tetratricopeptide (TPR) repeat protein